MIRAIAFILMVFMLSGCKQLNKNGIGVSTVETTPHVDVFDALFDRAELKKKFAALKFDTQEQYAAFMKEITFLQGEVNERENENHRIAAEKQAEINRLAEEAKTERTIKERKARAQN